MNALHPKAAFWTRSGIYDGLVSFADFEARVNKLAEEKDRGDAFEVFIEAYLATQFIAQRVQHWVVGGIPLELRERYKLPRDGTGIDGIYQTHDGTHVAYQVKYRQSGRLSFAEVAPFLGITEKFTDRVIFTNAATLSDKVHDRSRWVSSEVFRSLPAGAFAGIEGWLKEKPVATKRPEPDPSYQTQALADIKATLGSRDRATVVMACGTGKTLVALWMAEQWGAKTILVLVPSLTLLNQTLTEWSRHTSWGSRFSYICVCSDPTVGLRDDAPIIDKSDIGFRVDTDPQIVRSFLQRQSDDVKVVFSTYQSAPVVGQGAAELLPFDLSIFDEAHKTTGHSGGAFGFGLSDNNIRISKRLFLTATPRHIDIRHRDKEGEFLVNSMDDDTVYGPRACTLSFAAAVRKEIICPYKVIISLIDKEMVDDFRRKHGITLVDNDEIGARWVANLIAIQRAIETVGASKIISFHSRVRSAQEFAAKNAHGLPFYLPGYEVRHVNGTQSSSDRAAIIQVFRSFPKAVLTNSRCLTEGVDIPAVDMVAFIDPRQSRIDIAQAVGRAMRKPREPTTKTVGYVVVPLFAGINDSDSLEAAIKSEKFEVVADVLNALGEHDEELVDIIRQLNEDRGAAQPFNPRRLHEKIEVLGPRVELDELSSSIFVELVDAIGIKWDQSYGRLVAFKRKEGHCRVPAKYTTTDGYRLGAWVDKQRTRATSTERKSRLDALGFDWAPHSTKWEVGFDHLREFKEKYGHVVMAAAYQSPDGYRLGQWVSVQRGEKVHLPEERVARLNALGFDWDVLNSRWGEGFRHFEEFVKQYGKSPISEQYRSPDGYRLGVWIRRQRARRNRRLLSPEQERRLTALGLSWDPFADQWEEGFRQLENFVRDHQHCKVPNDYISSDGFALGAWVAHQRQRVRKGDVLPEQSGRLDVLGFVWDPLADQWEEGFRHLEDFVRDHQHCVVPGRHISPDGFRLGTWARHQESNFKKNLLDATRERRLSKLNFGWDRQNTQWMNGLEHLHQFAKEHGHCRVPFLYICSDGFRLGKWVNKQRTGFAQGTLPSERRAQLDAVEFVWRATART